MRINKGREYFKNDCIRKFPHRTIARFGAIDYKPRAKTGHARTSTKMKP